MPYLGNEDVYELVMWFEDRGATWEERPRPADLSPGDPRQVGAYARTHERHGPWAGIVHDADGEGPHLIAPGLWRRLDRAELALRCERVGEARVFTVSDAGGELLRLRYPCRPYGWGWYCAEEEDTDLFLRLSLRYRLLP